MLYHVTKPGYVSDTNWIYHGSENELRYLTDPVDVQPQM